MLRNFIVIALRNIWKNKLFSFINITGLAVGMAACLAIILFIQDELSFDTFHPDGDRIYRVLTIDSAFGVSSQDVGITIPALGPALRERFPEVEDMLRINFANRSLLRYEDKTVYAENMRFADSTFFNFFNFPLIAGDAKTALMEPFVVLITEGFSKKMFGDEDPMGKTLTTAQGNDLKIVGVLADLPENTHLNFDVLGSLLTLETLARERQQDTTRPIWLESWGMIAMPTYVKLTPGASEEVLEAQLTDFIREHEVSDNFDVTLQPLNDIHLKAANIVFDPAERKSEMTGVYTFAAVAVLILIIASVNFMNLSTARSTGRAKEVGLRKVVGSNRNQLILQFLGESLFITFISLICSVFITILTLPLLNKLAGKTLELDLVHNSWISGGMFIILFVVGFAAGTYPALFLSRFKPAEVLKGSFRTSSKGTLLRRVLVIVQFALSIALISGTMLVHQQIRYIQNRNLGYNKDQVLILRLEDRILRQSKETFRSELQSIPAIESIGFSSGIPGETFGRTGLRPEGTSDEDNYIWSALGIDYDFIPTLQMNIAQGRNFSLDYASDSSGAVIINQAAANSLQWENAIDKKIYFGQEDSVGVRVIGVVGDFHFASMHEKIEPVVMFMNPDRAAVMSLRLSTENISETMNQIENKWNELYPDHPFEYSFLDDQFNNLYQRETRFGTLTSGFSGLAIFIACLGLFGLASYSIEQRRKEIGVRKVLGASIGNLTNLLVLDFIRWVLIANLVGWPIAWYAGNKWLSSFEYRIDLAWEAFLLAGLSALIIAVLTVMGHALRAAIANPVKALRYE